MDKVLVIIIFYCSRIGLNTLPQVIVWNVGQGLWVTAATPTACLHFDAGGEKKYFLKNLPSLEKLCRHLPNIFSFSHWDLDHISFVGGFYKKGFKGCLLHTPNGSTISQRKREWLNLYPKCHENVVAIKEIKFPYNEKISNESSRVFTFGRFILPGDSTIQNEKHWAPQVGLAPNQILILGHHGSRTSTGSFLLTQLTGLKTAVASANLKRYGHPHKEVQIRLKKQGVSLLRNEHWGNIHFQ